MLFLITFQNYYNFDQIKISIILNQISMKRASLILMTGFFVFSGILAFGQKLVSGDVKVLKGQNLINLQFDYSKVAVGKYKSESEYIAKGIEERNSKKAGSGDEWAEKWKSDRKNKFEPSFQDEFSSALKAFDVKGKDGAVEAKYTLICYTTFVEPGFNASMAIGFAKKPAYIDMTIDVVETQKPGTVLATIELKKVESKSMGGYDYDTGGRINSCYERAGDNLGTFLKKNVFKN
jgi:hypothetical protein